MHDYMRVTSPRLWMILAAIVILLAGFIAYASTTTMESTVPIKVHVDVFEYRENDSEDSPLIRNYSIYADIPTTMKDVIDNGKVVRIGDSVTGKVYYIGNSRDDEYLNVLIDLDPGSSAPKAGIMTRCWCWSPRRPSASSGINDGCLPLRMKCILQSILLDKRKKRL